MTKTRPARREVGWARERALQAAIGQIERSFGRGAIWRLDGAPVPPVAVIPTGSLPLDLAPWVGGLPRGRITEVHGPEGSGKTTLALSVVAQAQAAGGTALYVDAEHALDPGYAARAGVDVGRLLVCQPDSGEHALDVVELLLRAGVLDVAVIDSVPALVPRAELDGEMGDRLHHLQSVLMARAMRKLAGVIATSGAVVVFCNQLREQVGVWAGGREYAPGGRALRHHASVRLDVRRVAALNDGGEVVGARTRVKVVKSKVGVPFRTAELDLFFHSGICREGGLLDLGGDLGVITRTGPTLAYGQTRLGQGRAQARAFLRDHPDLAGRLDQDLRARVGLGGVPEPAGPAQPGSHLCLVREAG